MSHNGYVFSDNQKASSSSSSSAVRLHRDSFGIVRACPISNVSLPLRRIYPLETPAKLVSPSITISPAKPERRPKSQNDGELLILEQVTGALSIKKLPKVLGILCCFWLIINPKKRVSFAGILAGMLIMAIINESN